LSIPLQSELLITFYHPNAAFPLWKSERGQNRNGVYQDENSLGAYDFPALPAGNNPILKKKNK